VTIAGKLRHRVVLQRPQTAQDDSGAVTPAWEDMAVVYAAVEPKGGREAFKSDKFSNQADALITIRYFDGLDESWRVMSQDRKQVWGITAVTRPYNMKREMQLTCVALPMGEQVS
jgi:SPP1 family predicted phage head-tail adaptor